jgi:hypothetical protein
MVDRNRYYQEREVMSSTSKLFMALLAVTTVTSIAPAFADHADREERRAERNLRHYEWREEQGLYGRHWGSLAADRQATYDAEMRQQWLAYHHGTWTQPYTWSMYNDPAFFDYLHTNQPSLLTKVRYDLGF